MIVEDSAVVRQLLLHIIAQDPRLAVVAAVGLLQGPHGREVQLAPVGGGDVVPPLGLRGRGLPLGPGHAGPGRTG